MVECFRCARTGLYYPKDIVERWGERYGRGLGKEPVSEAFVNMYQFPISASRIKSAKMMHPLANCRSQLDFMVVDDEEYAAHIPVILLDDPDLVEIVEIMRDKQLQKSAELQSLYPREIEPAKERISVRLEQNRKILGIESVKVTAPSEKTKK